MDKYLLSGTCFRGDVFASNFVLFDISSRLTASTLMAKMHSYNARIACER